MLYVMIARKRKERKMVLELSKEGMKEIKMTRELRTCSN